MIYLNEEIKSYSLTFKYNEQDINFESSKAIDLYIDVVNWLNKNGYKFSGETHNNFIRKTFTMDEVKEILKSHPSYKSRGINGVFFKIADTDKYMYKGGNIDKIYPNIIKYLVNFGINSGDIKSSGLGSEIIKIKKFGEVNEPESNILKKSEVDDNLTNQIDPEENINKIKIFTKNPFRQSICVLGESGSGKSTTLEHILEFEGHEFEFIIPSASTTGLLSQFSPSRSGYIPSRLGKMIVEAFNNPTNLYTAVFDECHKSNVIEMINDELLQAISTKRNMGRRFISLDEDTSELYKGVETFRGNILIPDNFGFIFISSKPRIISNNTDFFNRVDLVVLTEADREMKTSEELLSKVLPEEEKVKLSSTRND
jgi:energy-coupling factor transporter ATP-binding protein EcfA2